MYEIKRMIHMHIINVNVHGKGSFVQKLFNTEVFLLYEPSKSMSSTMPVYLPTHTNSLYR